MAYSTQHHTCTNHVNDSNQASCFVMSLSTPAPCSCPARARAPVLQHVLEVLLSQYSFPLLLVVLLQRVMSISPEQLLERLQAKAASLGDANPWLVQVRQGVTGCSWAAAGAGKDCAACRHRPASAGPTEHENLFLLQVCTITAAM